MPYIDGFLLAVPKRRMDAYKRMARRAARLWRKCGALEYRECVGDDLKAQWGTPFPKAARVKPGETVVFSWIVYKNKRSRDRVNKKVMLDPWMKKVMNQPMPFDMKRMSYGGFRVIVDR